MKFLLLLLLSFSCSSAFSQLQIEEKSKVYISHSADDLVKFVYANHFDYALMSWYSSGWDENIAEIFCLFRQNYNWYLAKISKNKGRSNEPFRYTIKQRKLTLVESDSVRLKINARLALNYSMVDFNKLHVPCKIVLGGVQSGGELTIVDAATFNLLQITNQQTRYIYFYAADEYYSSCYPNVKAFGILTGLVNSVTQLYKQTKDLKN